ncbi:MAG: hypothetical protein ABI880_13880, partial [Acidobacteriota bacterium]
MHTTTRVRILVSSVVTACAAVAITLGAASEPGGQSGAAATTAKAYYLANAGVLVTHGDTKVVFDPLFR